MATPALYFEDVQMGDEIGPVERMVTDDQVLEFVKLRGGGSGPSRFTDPGAARKAGVSAPIVPGAMSIALLSRLLTDWSPTVTVKKVDVMFRQVVPHNVLLQFKGIVTDKNVVDGEPRVECDVFYGRRGGDAAGHG